jgi:hypothetical protein
VNAEEEYLKEEILELLCPRMTARNFSILANDYCGNCCPSDL